MGLAFARILISLFIILEVCSCQMFFGKDESLSQRPTNNRTNKIKLSGYFYVEFSEMVVIYFLNENGTIFQASGFPKSEWKESEESLGSNSKIAANLRYNWGVYRIKEDSIQFERWYPSERPYKTAMSKGIILNDSTFTITEVVSSNGSFSSVNEVYRFRRFTPKPDSTTSFIKL